MGRKWAWVVSDEEKLNMAASAVCVFVIVFAVVFVHFGDAPRQLPAVLAATANVYFLRCASLGSSKYVDLALSTLFFVFSVVINVVP
jgi:hypothetical protein